MSRQLSPHPERPGKLRPTVLGEADMRVETVVVGAGPAGTAAAITLARAGRDVLIVDKAGFPRDKCCGDGLTTMAMRELDALGFDMSQADSWQVVSDVVLSSPNGTEGKYRLSTKSGYQAAVVPRTQLDHSLVELAQDSGAQLLTNCRVLNVEASEHQVELLATKELSKDALQPNPRSNGSRPTQQVRILTDAEPNPETRHGPSSKPTQQLRILTGDEVRNAGEISAGSNSTQQVCIMTGDEVRNTGETSAGSKPTQQLRIVADHVIAADGMWSQVRKSLGLAKENYFGDWHAFRQYFHNVEGRAATNLIVWFEPDLLPGYAWSFPLGNGRANVGFGINRKVRRSVGELRSVWEELLARPHIATSLGKSATATAPVKAWPIPTAIGQVPIVGKRTMFVGDAAALGDTLTGEGIGQALLSGRLAANAILTSASLCPSSAPSTLSGRLAANAILTARNDRPKEMQPTAIYERAVRRNLVADDRMSRALSFVLRKPTLANAALRLGAATPFTRKHFVRWMFEDYPRALVATPRRWRKSALGCDRLRGSAGNLVATPRRWRENARCD